MMKTADVNKDLIGRRCECISLGMVVTGVIEDIALTKYTARVKVRYDEPQRRGQEILYSGWSQGDKGGGRWWLTPIRPTAAGTHCPRL